MPYHGLQYNSAGRCTHMPAQQTINIDAGGVGSAIGIGRAGAILAPTAAGVLLDAGWTPEQLYFGVAGVVVLAAVALFALRPARSTDASSEPVPAAVSTDSAR